MAIHAEILGAILTICAGREHDSFRSGVKRTEQFFDQPSFDTARFAWGNQVTNNRFQSGVFADAENYARMLVHL